MQIFRFVILGAALVAAFLVASVSHGALIVYDANLDGPSESPPNASPGTGLGIITYDNVANTMRVQMTFTGLLGTTTASHIHSATTVAFTGTAGVATQTPYFSGFPIGVTSGVYDNTFDMSLATSYNPAFITANGGSVATAEPLLLASFNTGQAYLNIHTSVVPGGEIRGFLVPVPEPATGALLAIGAVVLAGYTWRRRTQVA